MSPTPQTPPTDRPLTAGDWIEWHGGENPVPDQVVAVQFRNGRHDKAYLSDDWGAAWQDNNSPYDIIAYRTARPATTAASEGEDEIGAEYDAAAHCVTLAACPPGLFFWNGTLGFKSEYGAMEPLGSNPHRNAWKVGNRADAYCADSGEYFWGGTSNHDDRAKLLVYPIAAETVAMVASHGPAALASPPVSERERELAVWTKVEATARRYAQCYPEASDGRNTFVMFAEWAASEALTAQPAGEGK